MGCDYEILVQVLYGDYWVTILTCGTKTSCGGYPLCHAARKFVETSKVTCEFGIEHSKLNSKSDAVEMILYDRMHSDHNLADKEDDEDDEVDSGVPENECDEIRAQYDHEGEWLYFTKEQFASFIGFIEPFTDDSRGDRNQYIDLMKPVPLWCDLARSALPYYHEKHWRGQYWMSERKEDIDGITKALHEKHHELWLKHQTNLIASFGSKLPLELVIFIAEYSMPMGREVRVAFNDDEGQCGVIRHNVRSPEVKLQLATKFKDQGTVHFKNMKYRHAIASYLTALEHVDRRKSVAGFHIIPAPTNYITPEMRQNVTAMKVVLKTNIATCYLKLNNGINAVKFANEAIQLDSTAWKSYTKLGEGLVLLKNYQDAIQAFNQADKYAPDVSSKATIQKLQQNAIKLYKMEKDKLKKAYKGMFNNV